MPEKDLATMATAEEFTGTEQLTVSDYAHYYFQRAMCAFGRHRYYRGWVGGRICIFCLHDEIA